MHLSLGHTTRIGIFGHCGNANLGDEATMAAVIHHVREHYPNAVLLGFTLNPEGTEKLHGIPSFPIRRRAARPEPPQQYDTFMPSPVERDQRGPVFRALKRCVRWVPSLYRRVRRIQLGMPGLAHCWREPSFLVDSYKTLHRIDLFIIAGSHQLNDYVGGPWDCLYTLLKWVVMAKLAGVKVAFLSVGAGPIRSWLGRLFAKIAVNLADYRSFRDQSSYHCMQQVGVNRQSCVSPDLVYSLPLKKTRLELEWAPSRPLVGLNPVPFVDPDHWPGADARKYEHYVTTFAEFALWLIQRGYMVLFYPTQLCLDPGVINDIRIVMDRVGRTEDRQYVADTPIRSLDELMSAISMMDVAVATRFHGIIFPLLLKKPVLGIAYHQKTIDLMASMGQSKWVVDIHQFHLEELQSRFLGLEAGLESAKQELDERLPRCRHALEEQYDRLTMLLQDKAA